MCFLNSGAALVILFHDNHARDSGISFGIRSAILQSQDASRRVLGFNLRELAYKRNFQASAESARGRTMRISEASAAKRVTWPTSGVPQVPLRRVRRAEHDNSLAGVLIFSGIGFALTVLAAILQWLELPPPYF